MSAIPLQCCFQVPVCSNGLRSGENAGHCLVNVNRQSSNEQSEVAHYSTYVASRWTAKNGTTVGRRTLLI